MHQKIRLTMLVFITAVSVIICNPALANEMTETSKLLHYYLDLIRSGNIESAIGLWWPSCTERAERLGIEYDDITIKADCHSPAVSLIDKTRDLFDTGPQSPITLGQGAVRWRFIVEPEGIGRLQKNYYVMKIDGYYWLITPYDYYAGEWRRLETQYFRFFVHPREERQLNDMALEALDSFVEKTAAKLQIDESEMNLLREKKIEYYLCPDEIEVRKLTGKEDAAVYDKSIDAVVAVSLSQYDAVAGLLINFKLKRLPFETLSLLRNGLATLLGGRSGRAPAVILSFGEYIHRYELIETDSLLIFDASYDSTGMADVACPLAAGMAEYLYDYLGTEKFFELYRQLSGDFESIRSLSPDAVKDRIVGRVGKDWDEIATAFDQHLGGYSRGKGLIYPGDIPVTAVLMEKDGVRISFSDEWVQIECRMANPDSGVTRIFFDSAEFPETFESRLNIELGASRGRENDYRYCLRLDRNEIGLYDFATNAILGKYIDNFENNSGYFDSGRGTVVAHFGIDLIDIAVFKDGKFYIEN
jgi:hypothetical protein